MGRRPRLTAVALGLARSCHPEPVIAVSLLTAALAWSAGRGWGSLLVLAAIMTGQLGVGWSNDYLDREADRRRRRTDKPLATGGVAARLVGAAALAAFAATVPLSLALGPLAAAAHAAALAMGVAYNLGLKDRPWSVVCYAAGFGLLPVIVSLSLDPPRPAHLWTVCAAALIGVAGHCTQVLRDIPADRAQGSRGLPQLLGRRWATVLAGGALVGALLAVALGRGMLTGPELGILALALVGTGAIGLSAWWNRPTLAFRLTMGVAALATVSLLAGNLSR
ncbi:MAG TPA: UbiA family prenyltransferase [Candidatus Dormibacteraeota bacterium]|jgi:4-hydroxybenzoate polyprenyltransferase|nr:UbiA family prenyltransferase [Candidatus Dormibacteraeota bacterium]